MSRSSILEKLAQPASNALPQAGIIDYTRSGQTSHDAEKRGLRAIGDGKEGKREKVIDAPEGSIASMTVNVEGKKKRAGRRAH